MQQCDFSLKSYHLKAAMFGYHVAIVYGLGSEAAMSPPIPFVCGSHVRSFDQWSAFCIRSNLHFIWPRAHCKCDRFSFRILRSCEHICKPMALQVASQSNTQRASRHLMPTGKTPARQTSPNARPAARHTNKHKSPQQNSD